LWQRSFIGVLLKLVLLFSLDAGDNGRPVGGETPSTDANLPVRPDNNDNQDKPNKGKHSKYRKFTIDLRSDAIVHPTTKVGAAADITLTNKDVKAILSKV